MGRRKKKRSKQKNSWNWPWVFNFGDKRNLTRTELMEKLMPLIHSFKRVDTMAEKFRGGGGCIGDLQDLNKILSERIEVQKSTFTLTNPAMIQAALYDLCTDLHFEVNSMPDQFPCYLICTISRQWDGPDILLDELYLSPRNCFFPDSRFVMLSRNGRSRLFLRLSIFRERLYEYIQSSKAAIDVDEECNNILEAIGTLVLKAAWYEDQRLAFHVSDVFKLYNFRSAMELLGFILGSDLYKVKTTLYNDSKYIVDFFEHIYVNRPLTELLRAISLSKFTNFAHLEEKAKESFLNLNVMFSDFLSTTDALQDLEIFPLYKIILGFYFNLRKIADRNFWKPKLREIIELIENNAKESSRDILEVLS